MHDAMFDAGRVECRWTDAFADKERHKVVKAAKRLSDVFFAFVALVVLAPLFLLVAVLIKLDSSGPVFYWGERTGKRGRPFRILKFRTMYEVPSSYDGPRVTGKGDRRVTSLGRWLRESKLNELPQLWNVVKGDMSLVGPRPEDPDIVAMWPDDDRREILSVRPGITSPASIIFRDEESLLSRENVMQTYFASVLPSKRRLDVLYVRHLSIWLDFDVMIWTLFVLIPQLSIRTPGEESIYWGPVARFGRRHLSWFMIDAILAAISFVIGMLVPVLFLRESQFGTLSIAIPLVFALTYSLVGALVGTNNIVWSRASTLDAVYLLPGWAAATGATLVMSHFTNRMSAKTIAISVCTFYAAAVAMRFRDRVEASLKRRLLLLSALPSGARERVLIVGVGTSGQFAAWQLQFQEVGLKAFQLVGYVDDDPTFTGLRIAGVKVLGTTTKIPQLVEKYDVGIIVVTVHNIDVDSRERLLERCRATSAEVVEMPDYLGQFNFLARGAKTRHRQSHNRVRDDFETAKHPPDFQRQ
jgi:lipopolysaccharide/colanic/teichoic acid biosynthesis glycosyltransferase